MRALRASGEPCSAPGWPCLAVSPTAAVPAAGRGEALLAMRGSCVNPLDVDLVEPSCKAFPPSTALHCTNGTV
eukprot:4211245-Pyramimonas_sp.AAC.1